jgi:RNA polymerase sigma factor (sigma-70 family)
MARASLNGVIPLLRRQSLAAPAGDAELLDRFVASRDADAFEALVRRHGPMVFAVCRRILRHTHDAEDAFQATFLVLAYKAGSVSPRGKLAGWLHGVASKTALKARHRAARRARVESQVPTRSADVMPDAPCTDAEPLLDQELTGLPERYRLPIILCDLEGRPRAEAATLLGCSEGTLSSRLTRGRRLLAERLKRRGVQLSVGALVGVLTAKAAIAEPLVRATLPVGLAPAAIPPTVAQLATGVMKAMLLKKLQAVALATLVAAGAAFALSGLLIERTEAAPTPKAPADPTLDDKAISEALATVDGNLLLNRKVIKDLKCDIDQLDKIMDKLEDAQRKSQQKTNEAMMGLKQNINGNVNPQAIQQMFKDAQEAGEKEFRKAVNEVVASLTPAQRLRLRQIDLQARGHAAFTLPSVAKDLKLTDKQKEQFAENVKRTAEDVQQALQKPVNPNGVFEFNFEKVTKEARAEGLKRAVAALTDDQKALWKKMTGEPVKYPLNQQWNFAQDLPLIGGFAGGFGGVQVVPAVPAVPVVPPPAPPK